jgi:hypothetical protein
MNGVPNPNVNVEVFCPTCSFCCEVITAAFAPRPAARRLNSGNKSLAPVSETNPTVWYGRGGGE